jgi:hypothetical protein
MDRIIDLKSINYKIKNTPANNGSQPMRVSEG